MPVEDMEPGTNPVASGVKTFGTQGNPSAVVIRVTDDSGSIEVNGTDVSTYTSWSAPSSYGANVSDAGAGFPPVGSRGEPGGVVRLRGRIVWTGTPAGGAELFTLDARDRPATTITHPGIRSGPTGNTSTVLTIAPTGVVSAVASPGANGYLGLDTITFTRA